MPEYHVVLKFWKGDVKSFANGNGCLLGSRPSNCNRVCKDSTAVVDSNDCQGSARGTVNSAGNAPCHEGVTSFLDGSQMLCWRGWSCNLGGSIRTHWKKHCKCWQPVKISTDWTRSTTDCGSCKMHRVLVYALHRRLSWLRSRSVSSVRSQATKHTSAKIRKKKQLEASSQLMELALPRSQMKIDQSSGWIDLSWIQGMDGSAKECVGNNDDWGEEALWLWPRDHE